MNLNDIRTYVVWCPELGQEGPVDGDYYTAISARGAAELWARREDWSTNTYDIAKGASRRVCVARYFGSQDNTTYHYIVTGRPAIEYTVSQETETHE